MEEIVIRSPQGYKQGRRFFRRQMRQPRVFSYIMLAFLLMTLAINFERIPEELSLPPFLIVFASVLFLVLYTNGIFYTRRADNRHLKMIRGGQVFRFGEEAFRVETKGEAVGEVTVQYDTIARAREDRMQFYLYVNRSSAYLISKSGFESGTPAALRALLRTKLGKRRCKLKK